MKLWPKQQRIRVPILTKYLRKGNRTIDNPGQQFKIQTDRLKIQSVDKYIWFLFSSKGPGTSLFKTTSFFDKTLSHVVFYVEIKFSSLIFKLFMFWLICEFKSFVVQAVTSRIFKFSLPSHFTLYINKLKNRNILTTKISSEDK